MDTKLLNLIEFISTNHSNGLPPRYYWRALLPMMEGCPSKRGYINDLLRLLYSTYTCSERNDLLGMWSIHSFFIKDREEYNSWTLSESFYGCTLLTYFPGLAFSEISRKNFGDMVDHIYSKGVKDLDIRSFFLRLSDYMEPRRNLSLEEKISSLRLRDSAGEMVKLILKNNEYKNI